MPIKFLSRLCGGEGENNLATIYAQFLSRLCGGEGVGEV